MGAGLSDAWGGAWGTPSAWDVSWGSAGSTPTPEPTLQSGVKHHPERRKRFVLPDGTLIVATWEEVERIVREAAQPKRETTTRRKATTVGAQKVIALGKVKAKPAVVSGEEVTRVELPKTYRWAPQRAWYDACLAALKAREDEEIMVMLALH